MDLDRAMWALAAPLPAAVLAVVALSTGGHPVLFACVLAAALAGGAAVWLGIATLSVGAAWALLLLAIPLLLGVSGYVVALSVVLLVAASRSLPAFRGPALVAARALAALVALAILAPLLWAARDGWPTLWPGHYALILAALAVVAIAWWPLRRPSSASSPHGSRPRT